MKRILAALLVAVCAVSSAWAEIVVHWTIYRNNFEKPRAEGIAIYETLPNSSFIEGYDTNNNYWWEITVYQKVGDVKEAPDWVKELGGKYDYTLFNPVYGENGNLTSWDLMEELVIPWEKYGITCEVGSGGLFDLSYNGIYLQIAEDGIFKFAGCDVGPINTSNPTATFDNIAQMWADSPDGAVVDVISSINGYLAVDYDGNRFYYDGANGGWYMSPNVELPISGNPWDDVTGGDGGDSGGDSGGSSGGSTGGGDGGGSSSGGGGSSGDGDGGGDGGGSSSGGGAVVVPDDGDDTGESGEDLEYDYRSVLQSINAGVSSVANQATVSNGTLTNIEGGLTDLAGEYVETDGASAVTSSDGSALSSASSSGLSGVSGTLDGVGADVSSGWSDVSANLFGWVDGFSKLPPSVLSMGSFKINLLGVQKDVNLDVNLSSVSDWLVLIRRALILLWGAITLFVVFRLFRWLTAEIVKGIRWLLGVIPKAFSIVATGA